MGKRDPVESNVVVDGPEARSDGQLNEPPDPKSLQRFPDVADGPGELRTPGLSTRWSCRPPPPPHARRETRARRAVPTGHCANTLALVEGPPIVLTAPNTILGGAATGPPVPVPTCRDEIVAAFQRLAEITDQDVFTGGRVYAEMALFETGHPKSTVLKTMRRMKEAPDRPQYVRLERVGTSGFRLLRLGCAETTIGAASALEFGTT